MDLKNYNINFTQQEYGYRYTLDPVKLSVSTSLSGHLFLLFRIREDAASIIQPVDR